MNGEPEREYPDFDEEDLAIADSVWDAVAEEEGMSADQPEGV